MNKYFHILAFVLSAHHAVAQSQIDLNLPAPEKFIDKVEAFGGVVLNFPNDHGWGEYVFKASHGRTIEKVNPQPAYLVGVGLVHSMDKRIELKVNLLFEKRLYTTNIDNLDLNGNVTSRSKTEQRNRYFGVSLTPVYFTSDSRRLHFFAGCSFRYLAGSIAYATYTSSGQSAGGASVNTIDGFEKHIVEALAGGGYLFPMGEKFSGCFRIYGNYGLSSTLNQNKQRLSINTVLISVGIRYLR